MTRGDRRDEKIFRIVLCSVSPEHRIGGALDVRLAGNENAVLPAVRRIFGSPASVVPFPNQTRCVLVFHLRIAGVDPVQPANTDRIRSAEEPFAMVTRVVS